jgi:Rrf2 family protein
MALNKRFAVAVHAMTAIGYVQRHGRDLVASEDIAKSVNTNPTVIRNLMRLLKKAGLIESKEGKGGGVCLAKDPRNIRLSSIYEAVEMPDIFRENDKPIDPACPVSCAMKRLIKPVYAEADSAIRKVLHRKSLHDLINAVD